MSLHSAGGTSGRIFCKGKYLHGAYAHTDWMARSNSVDDRSRNEVDVVFHGLHLAVVKRRNAIERCDVGIR